MLGCLFLKDFIYLFLEKGEVREKDRERNINVWLPLMYPQLGIQPATQACALTGNWTGYPLVHRPGLNPLSHTSQGKRFWVFFFKDFIDLFFREREREGEREWEKHWFAKDLVASHTPLTGDVPLNPGMCPDGESNQRPFGLPGNAQPSELHQ